MHNTADGTHREKVYKEVAIFIHKAHLKWGYG
jgi:hypothetical protein